MIPREDHFPHRSLEMNELFDPHTLHEFTGGGRDQVPQIYAHRKVSKGSDDRFTIPCSYIKRSLEILQNFRWKDVIRFSLSLSLSGL